ncbi:MAG: peptidylprolyl isomerase, partial [Deltaproteobacteria bacterium]|nr:peptidylprolyl isomerase [Deltaproteobacteria bacterium]
AEAISSYYEKNKMQYTKQKEVKASHILIRPKKGDDPTAERDKARVAAEGILANARSGGNFAKLAKEHSEDPGSGQKGGDLGWFGRGMMVRLFEDSAFSLGKGKISDLVETEYGFHIIKVIDIKEAKVVSLKEATPAIRTRLLAGEAETEGRTIMATLYDVFNSGGSDDKEVARLVEEAKSRGVTAKATGLFSANTSSEEVVRNEKLKQSAFNLESGSVSGTLDTKEGFYILKILERIEPHVPPFADVAVEVRDALRGVKATEAAEKQAENILDKLKKGESFAELLKAEKLSSSTTKFFTKVSGFIPEVGAYVGDREGFFDLKPEAPYFKEVLDHRGDFYVFKLKEVREVKDALFAEKKASFGEELLSKKKQEAVVDWLDELRSSSEIIENEQYL